MEEGGDTRCGVKRRLAHHDLVSTTSKSQVGSTIWESHAHLVNRSAQLEFPHNETLNFIIFR